MNMRISIANIFTHLFLLLALLATASCSDWTDQKTVDIDPQPEEHLPRRFHGGTRQRNPKD